MPKDRLTALVLLLAGALAVAKPVDSGEVLTSVKARGMLRCGVSEGIPGFSQRDAAGRWQGLDADFCRAVAAAVVGDGEKVEFVPLKASTRFPALQARRIDLLARNTSWTLTREAILKVRFPAVLYYDGQAFLVPTAAGISTPEQLKGSTICVEKGTTHERNLARYARRRGLSFTPLVIDSVSEVAAAFFGGRCNVLTSDATQLAAARLQAPGGPDGYRILPERISKEPLAPVVWGDDPEWATVVRWVLFVLLLAEEEEVTRDNLDRKAAGDEGQIASLSDEEKALLGQALGLPKGWALRAIAAAGNYGEMFERNLGGGSELAIERGLNRLWTQGGLMYAPPID